MFPNPKIARRPLTPDFTMQQKQMRRSRMIPAMTPITIPAIAPPERPLLVVLADTIGKPVEPLALAAGRKVCVVVMELVAVAVLTPPLVPLTGAE